MSSDERCGRQVALFGGRALRCASTARTAVRFAQRDGGDASCRPLMLWPSHSHNIAWVRTASRKRRTGYRRSSIRPLPAKKSSFPVMAVVSGDTVSWLRSHRVGRQRDLAAGELLSHMRDEE